MTGILVVSGAAGVGKSTVLQACAANDDQLTPIVKGTTRPNRPGELNPDCVHDPELRPHSGDTKQVLIYSANQNLYSINLDSVGKARQSRKRPAIIVSDAATIDKLRNLFPGQVTVVFIHRDRTMESVRELVRTRLLIGATVVPADLEEMVEAEAQARWATREAIYDQLASGELRPDHVVFNNGTITRAVRWMQRIIRESLAPPA